jgi:signal transduction histidine kinase
MDVTELRQVQQLVTDLQRKETLLARLATLGEVAAGMTHEINNPLTVISSGLYALKDRLLELGPIDDDVTQLIEMMSKASGHMVSIVEGARHLSRADSKQPFTNAALWSLVQDAQALCGDKIKSSSTVVRNLVAPDLTIYCQPSSLLQIMINLFSNSCDALEELGIDYASRWIEVAATATESHVRITLTDSGPGIPASVQHTMFQPFFTTKPPGKGTGLGLSIVKSLAAQHQGRIYVDGEHPHTRFVLELPRQKA